MIETLVTIPVIARELGIAYQTAYRWVAVQKAVPSEKLGDKLIVVKQSDFEKFAADYRAGKYARWQE
jgi:hypothetical protein